MREQEVLAKLTRDYVEKFGFLPCRDLDAMFYLGDSVERRTWSCSSCQIPTLRTTPGIMWVPSKKRWATAKELLLAMGFPVYEQFAQAMGVPTMRFEDVEHCRGFLGNAMHGCCAGIVFTVALACVREK
jgi:hypothetical protein